MSQIRHPHWDVFDAQAQPEYRRRGRRASFNRMGRGGGGLAGCRLLFWRDGFPRLLGAGSTSAGMYGTGWAGMMGVGLGRGVGRLPLDTSTGRFRLRRMSGPTPGRVARLRFLSRRAHYTYTAYTDSRCTEATDNVSLSTVPPPDNLNLESQQWPEPDRGRLGQAGRLQEKRQRVRGDRLRCAVRDHERRRLREQHDD